MSTRTIGASPPFRPITAALLAGARFVPATVQRSCLETVLGRILQFHVESGDLDFLAGRVLSVAITDLGWRWPLTLAGGSLVCLPATCRPDVVIRGNSGAFLRLALRRADPDTIFFQRSLVIEGDTELGLAAKNFLDSVEWEQWAILRHAPRWTGLKKRVQP